jgi:hypothetical protein
MNVVRNSFLIANEMLSGGSVDRIKRAMLSHDPLIKYSATSENDRRSYETDIRFIYKLKDSRSLEEKANLVKSALKSLGATINHLQEESKAVYFEMFDGSKDYKVSVTKSQVTIKVVE